VSFRDDHEAAIARVDALEVEVARLKADCDRLERDNERLQAENTDLRKQLPKPKPPKPPKPAKPEPAQAPRVGRKQLWRAAGVAGAIGLFALMVLAPVCAERANERDYQQALASYEQTKARWSALISFEECARDTLFDIADYKNLDATTSDPRQERYRQVSEIKNCVKGLDALQVLPELAPIRQPLIDWRRSHDALAQPNHQLADYYSKGDWKDDNYQSGPALWAAFKPALLAFETATIAVLARGSLATRAEIRATQRVLEAKHGKDSTWWRIEVGLARNELASVMPLGGTHADAIAKAKALRALIATAPLELRRDWRSMIDELGWVEAGHKPPWDVSDYNQWSATDDDGKGVVPKRPERKEGC